MSSYQIVLFGNILFLFSCFSTLYVFSSSEHTWFFKVILKSSDWIIPWILHLCISLFNAFFKKLASINWTIDLFLNYINWSTIFIKIPFKVRIWWFLMNIYSWNNIKIWKIAIITNAMPLYIQPSPHLAISPFEITDLSILDVI